MTLPLYHTVYHEGEMIDVLGGLGGYIVAPTHQLQGDTRIDNVMALFDAVHDYRWKGEQERDYTGHRGGLVCGADAVL